MKTVFFSISVLLLCTFFTHQSFSQSLSLTENPNQNLQLLPSQIVLPQAVCGQTTITQSISQTLPNNGLACNNGDEIRENSFYRAFDLSSFGIQNDFEICQVQVGIRRATAGSGGQQPATLNLYTSSEPFPQGFPGSLTLIGTTGVIQIANQFMTILTIPVTGTAPLDSELVVELFLPNGTDTGNEFFLGTNSLGETGPGYIRAPECGFPNPLPVAPLPSFIAHIVMNVTGNELDPVSISLGPDTATNPTRTEHTVIAAIDDNGVPVEGTLVSFEVLSGPNQGTVSEPELSVSAANERQVSVRNSVACTPNADCTTDANGQVSWTYLGGRDVGTDTISASFINMNGAIIVSNFAQITWFAVPIPTLSQWGIISMAGILGLIGFIALRKRKAAA